MAPTLQCSYDDHLDGVAVVDDLDHLELDDLRQHREDLPRLVLRIALAYRRQHLRLDAGRRNRRRPLRRQAESQQSHRYEGQTVRQFPSEEGRHPYVGHLGHLGHSFHPGHRVSRLDHAGVGLGLRDLVVVESVGQWPTEAVHPEVEEWGDPSDSWVVEAAPTELVRSEQWPAIAVEASAQSLVVLRPQRLLALGQGAREQSVALQRSDAARWALRPAAPALDSEPARSARLQDVNARLDARLAWPLRSSEVVVRLLRRVAVLE